MGNTLVMKGKEDGTPLTTPKPPPSLAVDTSLSALLWKVLCERAASRPRPVWPLQAHPHTACSQGPLVVTILSSGARGHRRALSPCSVWVSHKTLPRDPFFPQEHQRLREAGLGQV